MGTELNKVIGLSKIETNQSTHKIISDRKQDIKEAEEEGVFFLFIFFLIDQCPFINRLKQ